MSLLQQLTSDMVTAMKKRDKETLNVVRMLKAAVQNEQIELGHDLDSNEELAVVSREYKQRKESLEEFENAGRVDLVNQTKKELMIVEKYMPKQLSQEDIITVVQGVIAELDAENIKDFGRVMRSVMSKVKGKAEGKVVNKIVKEQLSK
ncbi:GatB/YqeY domain-containing protein [Limosilactobacillus agrestis]|uniref:GatB/YqeY domain-containing protein n=1 Tax=Limosilactobacillus agrestis TaxID=2759748 RepID=A0A7W3YME9_9LACO|nr:GatB/YqeY domain-containing protein [Limosilactobacillus agrestis]MBD5090488.1 GatB/YqeY domain-containing protein [Lactobacillus sp.]MBB1096197.1 GatB/YqeY domain-containing protein [Limosilactobacillus agrestis]MBB1099501.1 GatB/YqeY domain-containing protein [Limosilactobacillus agrestis]MCD7113320.1 GatB/YqeY domain-containing protein [Limosilactobacillus agrestis]MCD7120312.1 GatB/YqeY domain-containing protein [Limosilactobacillus agrestis]